jgi:hypothetical protein
MPTAVVKSRYRSCSECVNMSFRLEEAKIVICVSRPKSVSFSSESGFSSRGLKTDEDKWHFLAEVHIEFFRRPQELQSKRQYWRYILQIYFVSTFFKYVDKFINTYILTIFL